MDQGLTFTELSVRELRLAMRLPAMPELHVENDCRTGHGLGMISNSTDWFSERRLLLKFWPPIRP